jgi:hypothetical protein
MKLEQFERLGLEQRLAITKYAVEADAFTKQKLWEEYGKDKPHWKHISSGFGWEIGTIAGRSIFMSFAWKQYYGEYVLFWEMTSVLQDYNMAEEFLKTNCVPDLLNVNADNFHRIRTKVVT